MFGLRALEQSILSEGDVHPDPLLRVAIVKDLLAVAHADNTKACDRNVQPGDDRELRPRRSPWGAERYPSRSSGDGRVSPGGRYVPGMHDRHLR